jgi:hypothetical protein
MISDGNAMRHVLKRFFFFCLARKITARELLKARALAMMT